MSVILACTWQPRGELNRLKRLYPQIDDLYDGFVLAVSANGISEVAESLEQFAIPYATYADYSGRHTVVEKATEFEFDYLHYVDFDRLLHWLETRPQELTNTVSRIQEVDCTIIGRTEAAFATHPQSMFQTEMLFNEVFSQWFKRSMDFGAGSRGLSRDAVEAILAHTDNTESLQMDIGWTVLVQRLGLTIDYVEVDGLDWETPDQFRDTVADEETRVQMAQKADDDPKHWALRVQAARKIIQAGLIVIDRELEAEAK